MAELQTWEYCQVLVEMTGTTPQVRGIMPVQFAEFGALPSPLHDYLAALGRSRWELTATLSTPDNARYFLVFKRPQVPQQTTEQQLSVIRVKEPDMDCPEACKASPLNAARNTTGSAPVVMWDKDGDGTYQPFAPRPGTGELERIALFYETTLNLDSDA